jgi:hypothetical protein
VLLLVQVDPASEYRFVSSIARPGAVAIQHFVRCVGRSGKLRDR